MTDASYPSRVRRALLPRLPAASRPRLSAVLGASIVLTGLTAASCGGDDPPVELASASVAAVTEVIDLPGSVTARAAATLGAPADGTLRELSARAGDPVQAGQVLAVIDSPTAQDRLKQAKQALDAVKRAGTGVGSGASLTRAQRSTDQAAAQAFDAALAAADKITDPAQRDAQLAQVKAAQRRYEAAARAVTDSVRAVRRGVAGLDSAVRALSTAQRLQAQQAYDLARATVDALTLRAPVDGIVQPGGTAAPSGDALANLFGAARAGSAPGAAAGIEAGGGTASATPLAGVDGAVPVGGRVSAGTPLLTVVDLSELGLVADVDETDVLLVTPGLAATVELEAVTGGVTYPAEVRSVDLLPTTSARGGVSYRVRFSLAGGSSPQGAPGPAPRPGMSAVIHLRVRQAAEAVTVPATAVFSAGGRDAVWVVRDGRADRASVTVGVQGQELVQIVDGVSPGDRVVARGTAAVRNGQQLR
jgi:HlyD family secretion protein